jgi:hypothetical protein
MITPQHRHSDVRVGTCVGSRDPPGSKPRSPAEPTVFESRLSQSSPVQPRQPWPFGQPVLGRMRHAGVSRATASGSALQPAPCRPTAPVARRISFAQTMYREWAPLPMTISPLPPAGRDGGGRPAEEGPCAGRHLLLPSSSRVPQFRENGVQPICLPRRLDERKEGGSGVGLFSKKPTRTVAVCEMCSKTEAEGCGWAVLGDDHAPGQGAPCGLPRGQQCGH